MAKLTLLVTLRANEGKEAEVEKFLQDAVSIVRAETGTKTWYAFKMTNSTFGIFDL